MYNLMKDPVLVHTLAEWDKFQAIYELSFYLFMHFSDVVSSTKFFVYIKNTYNRFEKKQHSYALVLHLYWRYIHIKVPKVII